MNPLLDKWQLPDLGKERVEISTVRGASQRSWSSLVTLLSFILVGLRGGYLVTLQEGSDAVFDRLAYTTWHWPLRARGKIPSIDGMGSLRDGSATYIPGG